MVSNEVEALIHSKEENSSKKALVKLGIRLKRVDLFVDVEIDEHHKTTDINEVPNISKVFKSLLSKLNYLKHYEEYLREEANIVQDTQNEGARNEHCCNEWCHESNSKEEKLEFEELGSLTELEVDDFSD